MSEEKKIEEKTADEWFDLGINTQNPEKKVEYFTKALEINPEDSFAWYNKAGAFLLLERYEDAIACYDKALEIDPNNAEAWHYKGLALDILSQCSKAQTCFEKAWELGYRNRFKMKNEGK